MRISDWSSHVCSSDLPTTVTDALGRLTAQTTFDKSGRRHEVTDARGTVTRFGYDQRNRVVERRVDPARSEEPTSELQSLMRISYAVICLKISNTTSLKTHQTQSQIEHVPPNTTY